MISWHKAGQKVACITPVWFAYDEQGSASPSTGPKLDEISTILEVVFIDQLGAVAFRLAEYPDCLPFSSTEFRPVYPSAIDDFRKLCLSSPQPVREPA